MAELRAGSLSSGILKHSSEIKPCWVGEWFISNETQRVGGRGTVTGNLRRKTELINKIKREWVSKRNWLQSKKERSWSVYWWSYWCIYCRTYQMIHDSGWIWFLIYVAGETMTATLSHSLSTWHFYTGPASWSICKDPLTPGNAWGFLGRGADTVLPTWWPFPFLLRESHFSSSAFPWPWLSGNQGPSPALGGGYWSVSQHGCLTFWHNSSWWDARGDQWGQFCGGFDWSWKDTGSSARFSVMT